jgi:hypothetical protein
MNELGRLAKPTSEQTILISVIESPRHYRVWWIIPGPALTDECGYEHHQSWRKLLFDFVTDKVIVYTAKKRRLNRTRAHQLRLQHLAGGYVIHQ